MAIGLGVPRPPIQLVDVDGTIRVRGVRDPGQDVTESLRDYGLEVARKLGVEWDAGLLVVPDANLHLGTTHLASLLERYEGDVIPALAAYNAGATPVRRWLRYPEAKDPVRFVERIPYAETRGYLRTVIRNRSLYRALYPPVTQSTAGDP